MSSETAKTVYFVRHGQSVDNISKVFQSVNSPLSELGEHQAEIIAERLVRIPFETLISSPLLRARQTAGPIAVRSGKQPVFSNLFVERVKPSSIDGKPYTDSHATDIYRRRQTTPYASGPYIEDGENFDNIVARSDKALKFPKDRPEESLVVVTHGYFLRAIVARVLVGEELSGSIMQTFQTSADTENTGITVLRHVRGYE